tara:strand:- start:93 stop:503 length:411 start_codon:yes stop_codon:yes gene_type:complete
MLHQIIVWVAVLCIAFLFVWFALIFIARWILEGAVVLVLAIGQAMDFISKKTQQHLLPKKLREANIDYTKTIIVFTFMLPLFPFWLVAQILQTDEVKKSVGYFHLAFLGLGATAVIAGLLFAIYYFGVGLVMLVNL